MRTKSLPIILIVASVLAAASLPAQQVSTAPVAIAVNDPSGTGVPGATIRIVPAPDPASKLETGSKGRLTLDLKPGGYALFVRAQGFKGFETHFDVREAKDVQTISVPLQIAGGSSAEVQPASAEDDLELRLYPYTARALLTPAEIKSMPHIAITVHNPHTNLDENYSGVRLAELLTKFGAPLGKELHGESLALYLVATGSDGYQAVLALAEVDPAFHPGEFIVADTMLIAGNDKPLDAHNGPFKLIVTEDKRPARWVRNLVSIELKSAQ
jgi:hypothetical protein